MMEAIKKKVDLLIDNAIASNLPVPNKLLINIPHTIDTIVIYTDIKKQDDYIIDIEQVFTQTQKPPF